MKLTTVVVAYWPSRFPSIPVIVNDLRTGTRAPDHIIVFNNNHRATIEPIEGASVINAGWNYTSRSKYAAAMLEPSDCYLLLDDDVSVCSGCIEYYHSIFYPGCCFSDCGGVMVSNYAHAMQVVGSVNITVSTPVDVFLGCVQLVSWKAIVNMLAAEESLRLPYLPLYRSVADDILIAMVNRPQSAIMPTRDPYHRKAMTQEGSAMQHDYGYYQLRDRFAFAAWTALGNPPFPGPAPTTRDVLDLSNIYLDTITKRDLGQIPVENQ
jgi:hypothetical protein